MGPPGADPCPDVARTSPPSPETCWAGSYRDVGDHEIELGDAGFSIRLRWRLEGDTLTFEMDPDEGEEGDRIAFTSAPWTRVEE